MKKFLAAVITVIFISSVFGVSAKSWYTQITKEHARPTVPDEAILKKYDAIALGPDQKKVYLTFDAGYENGNVKRIADILKKNNVRGAFFILSNIVETHPQLIKQLISDGNLVCNHTRKHPDMSAKSEQNFKNELTSMEEYFKGKTGHEIAKFYRPPEGKYTSENLKWAKEMGYKTVFWSVAYHDWDNNKQMPRDKALNILLGRAHNGAVYLLHPTSKTNAEVLDEFIKKLKSEGYEFGLISEME
ncbi:MAG: delta-lactam-biosynthetic de-N-acetylase [Ruminococcaceae bacterium]|nr:delta-lactam-biosynthetic de-N-acetylase [Oscillospiraceae bacterium]